MDTVIVAPNPEADALIEALEDLAGRLRLRIRVERRATLPPESPWPDDVVAGVWIDARAADRIDIRMTSVRPHSEPRSFERSLAREGSTAVVVEAVAQVVRAALESMLAAPPEVPADVPSASPAPEPPAPEPPEARLAAAPKRVGSSGLGVDVTAFGSERAMNARSGPVLGVGAALEVSSKLDAWRPSVWLSAAYNARFDVQSGPITFDVGTSSFRLMPGVALVELDAMQVDVDVGGGLDLFRVAPLVVRREQATFGDTMNFVDPVLAGQLLMRLRLVSQVRMTFGFGLDYDFVPRDITVPGGPRGTFEPWRLRPALSLGLCVPLSSGGACMNAR
jgi:hypothetical protein